VPSFDQVSDAMREHRSFAGSGAGDDEHRPVNVVDGFALAFVRGKAGVGLRGRHFGSA
jgi:hypothetical protein